MEMQNNKNNFWLGLNAYIKQKINKYNEIT